MSQSFKMRILLKEKENKRHLYIITESCHRWLSELSTLIFHPTKPHHITYSKSINFSTFKLQTAIMFLKTFRLSSSYFEWVKRLSYVTRTEDQSCWCHAQIMFCYAPYMNALHLRGLTTKLSTTKLRSVPS